MTHFLMLATLLFASVALLEGKPRQCYIGSMRFHKLHRTTSRTDACILSFNRDSRMTVSSFHEEEDVLKTMTSARKQFEKEHIFNCGTVYNKEFHGNMIVCACYYDNCNHPNYYSRFTALNSNTIRRKDIPDVNVTDHFP